MLTFRLRAARGTCMGTTRQGGGTTRRELMRRALAAGASTAIVVTTMTGSAAAQATPVADTPVAGDPIRIGVAISTSGSNGKPGLYQQEAYLLWEAQKNATGGLLGRPVEMVIYDDESDPDLTARIYER